MSGNGYRRMGGVLPGIGANMGDDLSRHYGKFLHDTCTKKLLLSRSNVFAMLFIWRSTRIQTIEKWKSCLFDKPSYPSTWSIQRCSIDKERYCRVLRSCLGRDSLCKNDVCIEPRRERHLDFWTFINRKRISQVRHQSVFVCACLQQIHS